MGKRKPKNKSKQTNIEERLKSLKKDIRRLKLSIKKKCRSCCGGVTSEIEKCQVKKCDLWKIIKGGKNGKA